MQTDYSVSAESASDKEIPGFSKFDELLCILPYFTMI